jgi:CubicO group peptidase (beta-lactamase class C family)
MLNPALATLLVAPLAPPKVPENYVAPDPVAQKLETFLNRHVPFGYSGSVLVARGGRVLLNKGYGLADDARRIGNRSETAHSIGSVTKQFTAAAVMKLEMMGKLDTADPISKHLPGVPADKEAVTLHHLLTHTAGLVDSVAGDYEAAERDETVRKALAAPLRSKVGERYEYSNLGYTLLAAIVERVSGVPFEQFLQERLFQPAGMTQTGYRLPKWKRDRLALAYSGGRATRPNPELTWPSWNVVGNGEILSTTSDMYRWHRALTGDAILDAKAKKKLYTPAQNDYAYGWEVRKTPLGTLYAHNGGSSTGTGTQYTRYVESDTVLIAFANRDAGSTLFGGRWEDQIPKLVAGGDVPMPPKVKDPLLPAPPIEGRYRSSDATVITVTRSGSTLRVGAADARAAALLFGTQGLPANANDLVRRSTALLQPLLKDDRTGVDAEIADRTRADRFVARLQARRANAERVAGALQSAEGMYARALGLEGADTAVVSRIVGERTTLYTTLYWKDGRLAGMSGGSSSELPGTLAVATRSGHLVTLDVASGASARLRMEDGGRRLVSEGAGAMVFSKEPQ